MPRKQPGPPCAICGKPSVAKKLCETHYRRLKRHGHFEQTRPKDWGQKSKHPLWEAWKGMLRGGRIGWSDFWSFVGDVGERPAAKHRLRRRDESRPFGPDNWYWSEPILGSGRVNETRERKAAYMRAWNAQNPIRKKQYDLKKYYGVTLAEYEALLVEQDGKCAVCGQKDNFFSLAVDHCHGSNRIRGLLCSLCNRGIGMFRDSPDLLMKAAEYIKNPKRLI